MFNPDPPGVFSKSIDPVDLENFDTKVFNIFFWGINKDDGTSDNRLTEEDALTAVAHLNIVYNPFGIFFKYYGHNYINSCKFYYVSQNYSDCNYIGELWNFVDDNPEYKKTDSFNIYVAYGSNFGGAAAANRPRLVTNSGSLIQNGIMQHEVAHCFNVRHTHAGFWSSDPNNDLCEHVTRDPLDPNYNADEAGDLVEDTAAVPNFRREHYFELLDQGYTPEQAEELDDLYK